jgi:hypothetical protein
LWLTAIAALASSAALRLAHAPFFRWGTMSFAFFVLSIGVLVVCIVGAWWMTARWPLARRLLSLRGIASLAVVPIHYALIELIAAAGVVPMGALGYLLASVGLVGASIALAVAFANGVDRWMSGVSSPLGAYVSAVLVVLCAAVVWLLPEARPAAFVAFVIGQLAIAALLAVRNQQRRRSAVAERALS